MIIIFGNQKGGCGKTTNCIQFANYLATKNISCVVLDVDFQKSIVDRRQQDLESFDNQPKYEVVDADMKDVAKTIEDFKAINDGHLLIDLPGRIDDESLLTILKNADVVVVPFRYDKLTMDSTALFIKIMEYYKIKAKIFFLPNNIESSVKYETKEQVKEILKQYGTVTDEIPSRVIMQRLYTIDIEKKAIDVVSNAYDCILQNAGIQ